MEQTSKIDTPSPLSREQVEAHCEVAEVSLSHKAVHDSLVKILAHDAAQRQIVAQRQGQIDKLAAYILTSVPGEPSQSGGAVDTAIRIMAQQAQEIKELEHEAMQEGEQFRQFAWEIVPDGIPIPIEGPISFSKLKEVVEAAIGRKAQEIERLKRQVGIWQAECNRWEAEYRTSCDKLAAMTRERDAAVSVCDDFKRGFDEARQQLATAQAMVKELEGSMEAWWQSL